MYDYRTMTPQEREEVVAERKRRGWPWHAPPHFGGETNTYMISAACYEHSPVVASPTRLTEFSEALVLGLKADLGVDVQAWVVLPNHYHLLVQIDLDVFRPWIARIHNGKSTQWNREDGTLGRKVWYRFSDRRVRSQRHYYASLNYVHANPVKHAYVARADEWPWSSLPRYLDQVGRERLVEWWIRYPVRDYGKGWDD